MNKDNYARGVYNPAYDQGIADLRDSSSYMKRIRTEKSKPYLNYTDTDVDHFLWNLRYKNKHVLDFDELDKVTFQELVDVLNKEVKRGRYLPYLGKRRDSYMYNWEIFQRGIHQSALYDPSESNLEDLMTDLTVQPITGTKMMDGGTQIKLIITYRNGGKALFKPMRFARDVETKPDHFYFSDYERHHAEIAAFHLDWVLGFYNVPPTVGRKINMTSEIKNVADLKLVNSFFMSPVDNVCFHGDCTHYCDINHAICGKPDMLEGSFATFLSSENMADRNTWINPWRRTYREDKMAYWEVKNDLCDLVKREPHFNKYRRLLDLIDMHIFDFLMGNMDRHHYETYKYFGNNTFQLHYDNGRGFGKTKHDEMSILAPLYQCCQINYSTFTKLVKLYLGPERLSDLMRRSLAKDSLTPILTEPHLYALDRRVIKILKEVYKCVREGRDVREVIINRPWQL